MYDHQTNSLWSHLVGAAVSGPLKEEKLKPLQSMFTRWEVWKRLHPDSSVLKTGRGSFLGSMRDPYESYYRSTDTGIIPTRLKDQRIYPKEFVLGLVMSEKAKAYPFSVLSRQPVINDTFQGVPLLVAFESESATGAIFARKIDGKVRSFKQVVRSGKRGLFVSDDATSSLWNGLSGTALHGPMRNKKLESLPMTPSFWFGWVDHYPNTELYRADK